MNYKVNFLIRLDDACPTMDLIKWNQIENLLDVYGIKPLVGIIPDNKDPEMIIDDHDDFFFDKVKRWEEKGWCLAMHGFNHLYSKSNGGINPVLKRSEFAGLSLEMQELKIRNAYRVFLDHNIKVDYFFAPSHTFDTNTLIALKKSTPIRKISDTISRIPYIFNEFIFFPLQFGKLRKIVLPGFWTFCLHPNSMTESEISSLEPFFKHNSKKFISFDDINIERLGTKSKFDSFLSFLYFIRRYFKNLFEN